MPEPSLVSEMHIERGKDSVYATGGRLGEAEIKAV
jgi:hypothetical protein